MRPCPRTDAWKKTNTCERVKIIIFLKKQNKYLEVETSLSWKKKLARECLGEGRFILWLEETRKTILSFIILMMIEVYFNEDWMFYG